MKKIALTGKYGAGKFALVDDESFDWLNQWKWHVSKGYAVRNVHVKNLPNKHFKMHRLLTNCPKGMEVDHINGNRLDNRKENLRTCNHQQNAMNVKKSRGNSKYKGVSWVSRDRAWSATIKFNRTNIFIGHFKTELEAAQAYNIRAKQLFGEYAKLNNITYVPIKKC